MLVKGNPKLPEWNSRRSSISTSSFLVVEQKRLLLLIFSGVNLLFFPPFFSLSLFLLNISFPVYDFFFYPVQKLYRERERVEKGARARACYYSNSTESGSSRSEQLLAVQQPEQLTINEEPIYIRPRCR